MFVDRVRVTIHAGNGGDGNLSFRHEKFRAKGGPDGGDGGNGGDVVLQASRNQNTLAAFRYKKLLQAKNGQPGGKRKRRGKTGEDVVAEVPIGTVITDKSGQVLADLASDSQTVIIAQGGKGGFGNAHFTSSTRQAPKIAEKGEKGDSIDAVFELKMIADVGIIGLPNAGKSTLLSVISNAKPEIADYPFTTLHPNLGVVDINSRHSLLMADIPGLIEGASQGRGLGDEFLRHVERTSVLLHLIDAYEADVMIAYRTINQELAEYKLDLSRRPQVVALTKIEGLSKKDLKQKLNQLKQAVAKSTPVTAFSSVSRAGLDELLRVLEKQVDKAKKHQARQTEKSENLPIIGLRDNDNWKVIKTDSGLLVTGKKIERFASRTRFGDGPSEERLRDILRKMGIMRELQRQGHEPGQSVRIGNPPIGSVDF